MKVLGVRMRFIFVICAIFFVPAAHAQDQAKVSYFEISHNLYKSVCILGIEGTITPVTSNLFKEKLTNPAKSCEKIAPVISIGASVGGDVQAAMEISELIMRNDLSTMIWQRPMSSENRYVDQHCLSSCALIFASGRDRYFPDISENNILGIHKPEFLQKRQDTVKAEMELDRVKYDFIDVFENNSIDPNFTISMFETKFEDIYYPKIRELLLWRVITSFEKPPSFTQLITK